MITMNELVCCCLNTYPHNCLNTNKIHCKCTQSAYFLFDIYLMYMNAWVQYMYIAEAPNVLSNKYDGVFIFVPLHTHLFRFIIFKAYTILQNLIQPK